MLYKNYTDLVNKLVWIIPKKSKRDNMRNILNDIVNTAYKVEYIINSNNSINDKDYIIINQCDGFAGQLGKYIFGEFIKDNYNKNVKYDTSWYSISGLDIEKKEKRKFDLLNCFEDIKIEIASNEEIEIYKRLFYYDSGDFYDLYRNKKRLYCHFHPYIGSFDKSYVMQKLDMHKNLHHKLKDNNLNLYNEIINHPASVAVHIRRGDIKAHGGFAVFKNNDLIYKEYIFKAIYLMIEKLKPIKPKFFFFSNDINWVKNNILRNLKKEVEYTYCNNDNKDTVYFDMYLMSSAKHMIFTIGAFSNAAYMFNKNKNIIVISPDNINSL